MSVSPRSGALMLRQGSQLRPRAPRSSPTPRAPRDGPSLRDCRSCHRSGRWRSTFPCRRFESTPGRFGSTPNAGRFDATCFPASVPPPSPLARRRPRRSRPRPSAVARATTKLLTRPFNRPGRFSETPNAGAGGSRFDVCTRVYNEVLDPLGHPRPRARAPRRGLRDRPAPRPAPACP